MDRSTWIKLSGGVVTAGAIVFAACLAGCGGGGGTTMERTWDGPIDAAAVYRHVEKMVGFGPRPAGSDALKATADYIEAEIEALGLELKRHEFTVEAAPGTTFRNLWCEIPGTDAKGRTMVVSAHYDTKKTTGHPKPEHNFRFVGAMDGATGSALLIELARELQKRENGPTIWLVWFDGEESIPFDWPEGGADTPYALIGSRAFAKKMLDEDVFPRVMVLFDLIGSKDFKLDRDSYSNQALQNMFAETATAMGQGERMYQFVQRDLIDDHRMFHAEGALVIDLIDFRHRTAFDRYRRGDQQKPPPEGTYRRWWHTPEDDLHNVDPIAIEFVGDLFLATLPKIESRFYN